MIAEANYKLKEIVNNISINQDSWSVFGTTDKGHRLFCRKLGLKLSSFIPFPHLSTYPLNGEMVMFVMELCISSHGIQLCLQVSTPSKKYKYYTMTQKKDNVLKYKCVDGCTTEIR